MSSPMEEIASLGWAAEIAQHQNDIKRQQAEIAAIKEGAGLYSGLTNEKKLDAIKSKEDAILACMTAIDRLREFQLQVLQQRKFNKGQLCLFLFSFFIYSPEYFVFLYECFSPE